MSAAPVTPTEWRVRSLSPKEGRAVFVLDLAATLARSEWTPEAIEAALRAVALKWERPFGEVAMFCRIAITGTTVSEKVNLLLAVVDQERVLRALLNLGQWEQDHCVWDG